MQPGDGLLVPPRWLWPLATWNGADAGAAGATTGRPRRTRRLVLGATGSPAERPDLAARRRRPTGSTPAGGPPAAPVEPVGRRLAARHALSQGFRRLRPMPPFRLVSDFAPAGDQPKAIAELAEGIEARRPVPDAARHHRLGQERHHRLDHRAGAAAHAGASPPTSRWPPSWPTSSGSSSPTTGSSTSSATTTTTNPRPTCRPRTPTSRRTRR